MKKFTTWKKAAIYLLSFSISLYLLLVIWVEYSQRQQEKEYEATKIAFEDFLPTKIENYPLLKEYYDQQFKVGKIRPRSGPEPLIIPKSQILFAESFESTEFECSGLSYSSTLAGLEKDKIKFENEINLKSYQLLKIFSDRFKSIPPIHYEYLNFVQDRTVTWKEFCTLINMYSAGAKYNRLCCTNLSVKAFSAI